MASVRERVSKSGETTWAVLYRVDKPGEPGVTKQASTTFASAKAAADFKALVEILGAERALRELASREETGLTLDELAARFFAWKAANGSVTPRVLADYRRDYANWIQDPPPPIEPLGRRRANSIDEVDVQHWVDALAAVPLAPKTVADKHMILHSLYKFGIAKSRRLVDCNPCLETQMPVRHKKGAKGATLLEWYAVRDAAREVDPDAADLLEFLAATGWRWSEGAALLVRYVEDVDDPETGRVTMFADMGAVWRKDAANRQALEEGAAKSDAGRRRTKLPGTAAAIVRRRLVGKGPDDLVFTNAAGRKWYQQNFLNRTLTRILKEAGLERRITPHFLRHTHVALLDKAGASLPEIQRRIGHESIKTTIDVYGGMIDQISDEALDRVDALLSGRAPASGEIVVGDVVLSLESSDDDRAAADEDRPEIIR